MSDYKIDKINISQRELAVEIERKEVYIKTLKKRLCRLDVLIEEEIENFENEYETCTKDDVILNVRKYKDLQIKINLRIGKQKEEIVILKNKQKALQDRER